MHYWIILPEAVIRRNKFLSASCSFFLKVMNIEFKKTREKETRVKKQGTRKEIQEIIKKSQI
jgi:hypothetical protein